MKKLIILILIIVSCQKEPQYKVRLISEVANKVTINEKQEYEFNGKVDYNISKETNNIFTSDSCEFFIYENDKMIFTSQGKCLGIWKLENNWEVWY